MININNFFKKNLNIKSFSFILFVLLIIIKFIWIANSMVIDDESYYYNYTKHLSAGYIDHGPVIAYFMKFGILIFGIYLDIKT